MNININTTERKFYRQLLELLRSFPPLNRCANNELDVLGELLYFNHVYSGLDQTIRNKIIFDYDTRVDICKNLNMNEAVFRNTLTQLRKKGLIKERQLIFKMPALTNNKFVISFTFNIESK